MDRAAARSSTTFIRRVVDAIDRSVAVAQELGFGECLAGVIRILSGGNDVQLDVAPQFAKDHVVGRIAAQLTWHVYIDEADSGGEATIRKRRWSPTGGPKQDSRYPHVIREEFAGTESSCSRRVRATS